MWSQSIKYIFANSKKRKKKERRRRRLRKKRLTASNKEICSRAPQPIITSVSSENPHFFFLHKYQYVSSDVEIYHSTHLWAQVKALGACGSRDNFEPDHEESYLRPLLCRWPPTVRLPRPSLAFCRGWHPSIVSLHLPENSDNTLVALVSDSMH